MAVQPDKRQYVPTSKYEDMFCLGSIVQWWDSLPHTLRQDIEGSGGEPGCIAKARRIFNHYADEASKDRRAPDETPRFEAGKRCTHGVLYSDHCKECARNGRYDNAGWPEE